MEGSGPDHGRRTLTPAIAVSALFVAACAVAAISFVAARGGLELPVASLASGAAILPSPTPLAPPTDAPTAEPSAPAMSPTPAVPTPAASPAVATPGPTPAASADPLAKLPPCPSQPGCYEYTIRPGDTLSGIASRYAIPVRIVRALNPELTDAGTIVVGRILYLGRSPFLRLEHCPDLGGCYLYEVRSGDTLSLIAARFGLTVQAILDANPDIADPNAIVTGAVVRLLETAAG